MFCSYRISTDKLSRGPSAIAEPLVTTRLTLHHFTSTADATATQNYASPKVQAYLASKTQPYTTVTTSFYNNTGQSQPPYYSLLSTAT